MLFKSCSRLCLFYHNNRRYWKERNNPMIQHGSQGAKHKCIQNLRCSEKAEPVQTGQLPLVLHTNHRFHRLPWTYINWTSRSSKWPDETRSDLGIGLQDTAFSGGWWNPWWSPTCPISSKILMKVYVVLQQERHKPNSYKKIELEH